MIYGAGSMLVRRDVLERYLDEPFSHEFAFTGGSDLEFFTRCRRDDEALLGRMILKCSKRRPVSHHSGVAAPPPFP